MLIDKRFMRVHTGNVDTLYKNAILTKDVLVKYRHSENSLIKYSLDPMENDWHFGLIKNISWFISRSYNRDNKGQISIWDNLNISSEEPTVVYDLNVRHITLGGIVESINAELYEIYMLKKEYVKKI